MAAQKSYPKTIVVPSRDDPTLLNDEALTGAIIGSMVGGRNHEITGALAGGMIGGMFGRERILKENREGRKVSDPGSLGTSVAIGTAMGAAIGGLVLFLTGPVGPVAAGVMVGGGALLTGIFSAVSHTQAEKDYENAKLYYDRNGQYKGLENEASPYVNSITPQEAQKLEARLRELEEKSKADSARSGAPSTLAAR